MFDLRHPFFNPLWRRVLTVVMASGWALVELATGSPGWALMFGAVGAWAAYALLLTWTPVEDKGRDQD
ncbi:hypothetical protein [Phaeobacter sp. HF9A]|uniref:hypothetical protein n=1 Tax=Phaeobacter sp. HF9A TaxID=2721561 RepID=UPI0020CA7A7D|nr:hypothetical protein [Phaeobacter sp. HF9A]